MLRSWLKEKENNMLIYSIYDTQRIYIKCLIEKNCIILFHAQWQSSPKLITYLILLYSPVHEVPDLVPVPREGETDHHW